MKRFIANAVAAFTFCFVASAAQAIPILWTLSNVSFTDQSTASGSFIFDADTSTYSSVSITTSALGTNYTTNELSPVPFGVDADGIELVDNFVLNNNAGKPILNLDFLSSLTNAGGVVGLLLGFPGFEGTCTAADCTSGGISREVAAGSLNGAPIPEPTTLALLGLGLAGLAASRRRKQ